MTVVAFFDLSMTSTGYAVGSRSMPQPNYGVFQPGDWSKPAYNLCAFWTLIATLHQQHQITHIACEQTYIDTGAYDHHATDSQLMLKGSLATFAGVYDLDWHEVSNASWFRHFVGTNAVPGLTRAKRRRERKLMSVAAAKMRGWDVSRDDMADALGGMEYLLCLLDPKYSISTTPLFAMKAQPK